MCVCVCVYIVHAALPSAIQSLCCDYCVLNQWWAVASALFRTSCLSCFLLLATSTTHMMVSLGPRKCLAVFVLRLRETESQRAESFPESVCEREDQLQFGKGILVEFIMA